MDHELTYFTFLKDPSTYQAQPGDLCVQVPAGISSAQDLANLLQERLNFPPIPRNSWHLLREYLGFWQEDPGKLPQRVVILHHDLPLWQAHRLWWLDMKGYLHALMDNIALFRENQGRGEQVQGPELVAIFPQAVYEELHAVLTRPPDWYLSLEFAGYDHPIATEIDPSWSLIQEYVGHLEGPMAEVCTLSREGVGIMRAQYLRHTGTYALQSFAPGGVIPLWASTKEQPANWPPTVSLAQAEESFQHFFTQEQRTGALFWLATPKSEYTTDAALKLAHFRGPEEALLGHIVPYEDPVCAILVQGEGEALREKNLVFDLEYWQQVLKQASASLHQRLTAICLVGRSDLPNAADLVRPLLKSPVKQERWISACFCGIWKDEEALPVLVNMLTDELPFDRPKESTWEERNEKETQYEWGWYDQWRWYVPYLLRHWQTPEVSEQLQQALTIWIQEEPTLRYEDIVPEEEPEEGEGWQTNLIGISFAAQLCFELGYRGNVVALDELPVGRRYKHDLRQAMQDGIRTRQHSKTALEEYQYRTRERKLPAFLGWVVSPY